ncbi:tetratricopeptide repeat protein [Roseomonas sp. NAR14]|uniref:Tetratricopeptide repeat protein n=1 Tax=Roseomonas acroporae TaxID=2937791 RepID=A0A9X1YGC3_9PROT|nr:tetratricopeptide repeat protein [Roseomonas acroporae]MCK8785761.1 tetratricopeptide repeat protein [Roseomonas acroporae]
MNTIFDPNSPAASGGAPPGTPPGAPPAADIIKDVDQKTFMQDVVQASREVPVLVDFWATWCGPCKQLTPTLEKVVTAAGGRVRLAKIDIDKNRALVQQLAQLGLPLQSVPTVAAFWQGQIADLFQGALPEGEVKKFVEALLKLAGGQMPAADLLAEAKAAAEEGDHRGALELYAALAQAEPENAEALAGLARSLLELGEEEQARQVLEGVPAALKSNAAIAGVRSALELAEAGRKAREGLAGFERRLAADPDDHEARIELAVALNAAGEREQAAEALLEAIRRDRAWNEEAARKQLLQFFEAWGFADPATQAARRKLSALLFR